MGTRTIEAGTLLPRKLLLVAGMYREGRRWLKEEHTALECMWHDTRCVVSSSDLAGMGLPSADILFAHNASPASIAAALQRRRVFVEKTPLVLAPSFVVFKAYCKLRGWKLTEALYGFRDLPLEMLHSEHYELVKLAGWETGRTRERLDRVAIWGMSLEEARALVSTGGLRP